MHLGKFVRGKLLSTWNPPAKDAVRINSIGFYFAESPDVGAFLWALTREHRGSFVGLRWRKSSFSTTAGYPQRFRPHLGVTPGIFLPLILNVA